MPAGRPTKYSDTMPKRTYKLCREAGLTDEQLATAFGVSKDTIYEWKNVHPEFSDAIKKGKDDFDSGTVEKSLLHRALGYSHPEDRIFNDNGTPLIVPTTKHYPPDTTAMIFWLKNRQPQRWRDRKEHQLAGDPDNPLSHAVTTTLDPNILAFRKALEEE
jgi:hypothetical protein